MFSWSFRRQLTIFGLFAAFVFAIVFALIYFFYHQNDGTHELPPARDLVILWSRILPVREGVVDVAAFLENPNLLLHSARFAYSIRLYDAKNILIAIKDGTTFIHPSERFLIFEPSIAIQNRTPTRAIVTVRDVAWEKTDVSSTLGVVVLRTNRLLEDPEPRLEVVIKNQSNESQGNMEASAVLWGVGDEVIGVSRTIIDELAGEEEKTLIFTWPRQIFGVDRAEIILRKIIRES